MSKKVTTAVDFLVGAGTGKRALWSGQVDHLPRTGDRVYLAEHGIELWVHEVKHRFATPQSKTRHIEVYLHREKPL